MSMRERERDIVEVLCFLQISSQTRIWYLFSISRLPVRYISRMGVLLSVVAHLKFLTKISNFAAAFLHLHLPPHRPCLLVYNKILCFIYKIIIDSVSVYFPVSLSLSKTELIVTIYNNLCSAETNCPPPQ